LSGVPKVISYTETFDEQADICDEAAADFLLFRLPAVTGLIRMPPLLLLLAKVE